MIAKQILIFILCLTLVFPGQSLSGTTSSLSSPLAELLLQHRELKSGVGSLEMISKHGQALVDTTFKLMADPKNNRFINSPDGLELRKHQQLLTNFLAIKNHFEKCVKTKNSNRKLQDRILQSSLQSMATFDVSALPCLAPNDNSLAKSYSDFNNKVMKAMKLVVKPSFQNDLSGQIITNTAKSMLAFKQKFNLDFMKNDLLTQEEMNEILENVCQKKAIALPNVAAASTDVCQKMGPHFKNQLAEKLIAFSKTQKGQEKLTVKKATASLNASIDRLNRGLDRIKVQKDAGYIYDSAKLEDQESKNNFDQYVSQYMLEVSREAGPLLLTKILKERAGSIKRFHSDDTTKNKKTTQFQFSHHKKIKAEDVKRSIKEAEEKIQAQASTVLTIVHKATKTKGKIIADDNDLNELVKINPFAAGELLLHKPEYSGLMCDSINKINQEDVSEEKLDKYFMIGTAVIGGGLILTGVGTLAGAYLITGSLSAGVAAGTIGGSILGYTALAGSALELVNAGYHGQKSYEQYQEMNRLEAAFITQNSDGMAIIEAKNSLIEFKDARLSAAISLASVGLNLATAGKLFNILKNTDAKITPDQIQTAAKILRYLGKTQVAKRLKDVALVSGRVGIEKLNSFLFYLVSVGESTRMKYLELLENNKNTPKELNAIIVSALENK